VGDTQSAKKMPGFWKRPVARMYSYNLDVGEHYYSPMTSYLDVERQTRGETPGALTFSERLAKKWINGRRYDSTDTRYARSSSMAREASSTAAATAAASAESARLNRAASEMRTSSTFGSQADASAASAFTDRSQLRQAAMSSSQTNLHSAYTSVQAQREESTQELTRASSSSATAKMVARMQQEQRQKFLNISQRSSTSRQARASRQEETTTVLKAANIQVDDAISKKIADIRMQPYVETQEVRDAEAATLRARARIMDLERELEDITKRAIMTSTKAVKSAKQMAYEASTAAEEEAKAASTKKSRKVIIESSSKIRG